jgi:hypothetical protein
MDIDVHIQGNALNITLENILIKGCQILLRHNDDNAEGEHVIFALNFSLELKN